MKNFDNVVIIVRPHQNFRFSSKFCEKLGWVGGIYFLFFQTALMNRTVLKETFNTFNLNCQNE